jgi:hypothetical protein
MWHVCWVAIAHDRPLAGTVCHRGLDAWLATDVPTGKPVSLAPEVLASLENALHRPAGVAAYAAPRPWGRQPQGVEVKDKTLSTLVRVCSHDDSRVGLRTLRRRRLTARGVPPIGPLQQVFEWWYVDGAVEPTTGARFCREWPYLHAEMFQLFVHPFAQAFPDRRNLLLLANRGPPLPSSPLPDNVCLLL